MTVLSFRHSRQRGIALIGLLVLLTLGASWWLVSALSNPVNRTASDRHHNAKVLKQAKEALTGWVAHNAAKSTEQNPGRVPCPEPLGSANNATGGVYDDSDDGIAAGGCALPAVGRLPWRTLGLDRLTDAAGEPLWYVVSAGWALIPGPPTPNTVINSNTAGQLTLDADADIVALIISPGRPVNIPGGGACVARNQTRVRQPGVNWDVRDFLDCENSDGDAIFATSDPTGSSNDQVLSLTATEVLRALEAAVGARYERDIAPVLRSVYSGVAWGGSSLLPFSLIFTNPAVAGAYDPVTAAPDTKGILPLSYSETAPNSGTPCAPSAAEPRCQPLWVAWTSGTISGPLINGSPSCNVTTTTHTQLDCTFYYTHSLSAPPASIGFTIQAEARNVGASLRSFNTGVPMTNVNAAGRTASGTLLSTGAGSITLNATAQPGPPLGLVNDLLCGLANILLQLLNNCYQQTVSVPIFLLADHSLVDVSDATHGWFLRNRWHEVSYYALAAGHAPGGGGSCTTSGTCLQVAHHPNDGKQRALILISGRSLTGAARPNGTLGDWLESANMDGASPFAVRDPTLTIPRSFNDRVAVIDSNP